MIRRCNITTSKSLSWSDGWYRSWGQHSCCSWSWGDTSSCSWAWFGGPFN